MKKISLIFFLSLLLVSALTAQVKQTGSIKGTVVDADGMPLPGVSIIVTGPALLGSVTYTTTEKGKFRAPALPPGSNYVVLTQLPGFQTVRRENIVIHVGMTLQVNFEMKLSEISEEILVVAPSPVIDLESSKMVVTLTKDVFERLPMSRSVTSAISIAPGVVSSSIHGGARGGIGNMFDGVQYQQPGQNARARAPSWDVIEEIEVITGGATAEAFNAIGGYLNVVTKSGGNKFSGDAQVYYTDESLTRIIIPDETLDAIGIAKPVAPILEYDISATLGGPIVNDRIWFLVNGGIQNSNRHGNFRPTTILGKQYDFFDRETRNSQIFGKLSFQISKKLKAFVLYSNSYNDTPRYYTGYGRTVEASKHNSSFGWNTNFNSTWLIDSNTFADVRIGYAHSNWTGKYTDEADENSPHYIDSYTGYLWGSANMAEFVYWTIFSGGATLTRFQDDFLGGNHEFKAGFEIVRSRYDAGNFRKNPVYWYYYDQNPYYYRGLYELDEPHPVYGDGRLGIYHVVTERGEGNLSGIFTRIGAFIQDSWTIKDRLTINVGVRFDNIRGRTPEIIKGASGGIAPAVGEAYFTPLYGFNPYGGMVYSAWENPFPYKFFSPNIGISYDLFGNGKTALKASFGIHAEGQSTSNWNKIHPMEQDYYSFNWWDLNNNGQPDDPPIDRYEHYGLSSPAGMQSDTWLNSIDPDIKVTYTDEISVSLEHELTTDFRVSVGWFYKNRKNLWSDLLYDYESERYWNTYEKAPDWWIPFTTTIPAYENFPAQELTMYFMSKDAPPQAIRRTNVPEAKLKYQSLEFLFNKRMSNGWQLGGSVVLSEQKGNYRLWHGAAYTGLAGDFLNPNFYINMDGDMRMSRPLMIKIYGTVTLPYNFLASFIYVHHDGEAWGRTVKVYPPSAWAAANNAESDSYTINVEPKGTRRMQAIDTVDFRLEKEFLLGKYGTFGVFVDVFNLLGRTTMSVKQNPGGSWKPVDPNTTVGTFSPSWTGVSGHSGTTIYKFSVRYSF